MRSPPRVKCFAVYNCLGDVCYLPAEEAILVSGFPSKKNNHHSVYFYPFEHGQSDPPVERMGYWYVYKGDDKPASACSVYEAAHILLMLGVPIEDFEEYVEPDFLKEIKKPGFWVKYTERWSERKAKNYRGMP